MSTQSHRSVIKEQLAPFWVYMWCLGNKLLPAMVPSFPLLSKRFGAAKRAYPSFRIPPKYRLLFEKSEADFHINRWIM